MTVAFQKTIPILRIFSVEKAKEFYVDYLGFSVDWEHHFEENTPAYLQVSRDGLLLHLSEHHGDCCPGSAVRWCWRGAAIVISRPRRASSLAYLGILHGCVRRRATMHCARSWPASMSVGRCACAGDVRTTTHDTVNGENRPLKTLHNAHAPA